MSEILQPIPEELESKEKFNPVEIIEYLKYCQDNIHKAYEANDEKRKQYWQKEFAKYEETHQEYLESELFKIPYEYLKNIADENSNRFIKILDLIGKFNHNYLSEIISEFSNQLPKIIHESNESTKREFFLLLYPFQDQEKNKNIILNIPIDEIENFGFELFNNLKNDWVGGWAKKIREKVLQETHLDAKTFHELADKWWPVSNNLESRDQTFFRNVQAIIELEKKQPGIVEKLYKEFRIIDFDRYSAELLIDMYENKDKDDLPFGVIIYPLADHNGAFYKNKEALENLYNSIKEKYHIRITEIKDKIQLVNFLRKMKTKYKQHKISFMILGGHGTKDSIDLGSSQVVGGKANKIHIDDLSDPRAKTKSIFFGEGASLILASCSTGDSSGDKEGIGQKLSNILGIKVIAPREPTNVESFGAGIKDNKIEFNVRYWKEEHRAAYLSGEKII